MMECHSAMERTNDKCNSMNESQKHYAEPRKRSYYVTYRYETLRKTKLLYCTESRSVGLEVGGGGWLQRVLSEMSLTAL